MNLGDSMRADGLRVSLSVDQESVKVAGRSVAAIVDREPRAFEMMDAGYSDQEPISIEVLKGVAGATGVAWIDGVSVPIDLRGYIPKNNDPCVVSGCNRTVNKITNAGAAWVLSTIKNT